MQTEVSHWPQDRSDSGPERDGQDMGTIKPGNTLSSLVSASTGCPSPSPPRPATHTHTRPSLSQHDPHTQAALSPTGPHRSVHTTTDPPSVGRGESTCRLPQLGLFALDLHSGLRPFPHQRFHLLPLPLWSQSHDLGCDALCTHISDNRMTVFQITESSINSLTRKWFISNFSKHWETNLVAT